jgi:WhiB family redox-sensing transcriptional regulator
VSDFLSSAYTAAPRATDDSWHERAVCPQTDPEAFFPEKGGSTKEGKRICHGCPVRHECLWTALEANERFGIWGGLAERERRRLVDWIGRDDFDELYIQAQRFDLDVDVVVNWCADPDLRERLLPTIDVADLDETADHTDPAWGDVAAAIADHTDPAWGDVATAIACRYDTPTTERLAG